MTLPFVPICLSEETMTLTDLSYEDKVKRVEKIHQIMGHPKKSVLKRFFNDSSENDRETLDVVEEVSDQCQVCLRHKRTPCDPKVGLPIATEFNQFVTLDFKGPINDSNHYIMYAIDSFSRLTRALIIKNKQPATIVKGIIEIWILGQGIGPGIPDKFFVDNGGEFNNKDVIDLAEKYGINLHTATAANSPFSNGLCERNHGIIDEMVKKIKAGDNSIKDKEALDYAIYSKNIQLNNKGFSPYQIVYGSNPRVPGISNSSPPSLSTEFTSKDIKDHINRVQLAREAFLKADHDERIKRGLKSRIFSYNNEIFEVGEKVYFKDKESHDKYKKEWSGPAKIVGIDGKVLFLRYGNMLRRVHTSKVVKVNNEYNNEKKSHNSTISETEKNVTKNQCDDTTAVDHCDDIAENDNEKGSFVVTGETDNKSSTKPDLVLDYQIV